MQALLQGDSDDGRAALRACINATIGFGRLGKVLGRPQKSLMRKFGSDGNPTAENRHPRAAGRDRVCISKSVL